MKVGGGSSEQSLSSFLKNSLELWFEIRDALQWLVVFSKTTSNEKHRTTETVGFALSWKMLQWHEPAVTCQAVPRGIGLTWAFTFSPECGHPHSKGLSLVPETTNPPVLEGSPMYLFGKQNSRNIELKAYKLVWFIARFTGPDGF